MPLHLKAPLDGEYPSNSVEGSFVMTDRLIALPKGHIFVPGMALQQRGTLFVTRCPCVELEHGHLLPVVASKPPEMPNEQWKELNERHFGEIIFGNSQNGHRPLPETIANGDLDGDLYFIC